MASTELTHSVQLTPWSSVVDVPSHSQRTLEFESKLRYNNKPGTHSCTLIGPLHPPHCFMKGLEVMNHSVTFMQVVCCRGMAQDKKGSCGQLTDSPLHWVPVHAPTEPSMKSHFLPSLWCLAVQGRWENDRHYSNPMLARLTMWGLCTLLDQQTERPFSWSNCFTNPTPAFLCTLIMLQTHAYSRANHVTSTGTPCKVIRREEDITVLWLHNVVNKRWAACLICVYVSCRDSLGFLQCFYPHWASSLFKTIILLIERL